MKSRWNHNRSYQRLAAVMNSQIYSLLVKVHCTQHTLLWDTGWWSLIWCPPTALNITRQPHHLPTCYFTFLDVDQSSAVINIWFCAASLGKQVWFQEERKQPHSIWHTRVITGGHVLGHLYLVWWGGEVPPRPSGHNPARPPRACSHRSVGLALTITFCKETFPSLVED